MSTVAITIDGADVTADVVYSTANFTSQVNGATGSAQFRIRDNNRTYSIVTGKELVLTIDGSVAWTGYVSQVKRVYQFPAQATNPLPGRFLDVTGVDINILFTKRIVFDQATPANIEGVQFPAYTADTTAITSLVTNFLDLSGDAIDTTTMVSHVADVNVDQPWNGWAGSWTWGQAMEAIARMPGAIYYIDPSRRLVYCDVDTPNATYGLSDQPVAGSSVGYREMEVLYDGSSLDNDHLVWGAGYGSQNVVFSETQDATSQAAHGKWQGGSYLLDVYKQATANAVGNSVVYGSPTNHRGAKDDRIAVTCSTFTGGFRVAQKVAFTSHAYGFSDVLPIRAMEITFPTPTGPKYRMTLSHSIDAPWGFVDVYFPKVVNIAPISVTPIPVNLPGPIINTSVPCNCGITDTFTRTVSSGWGTSDAGIAWVYQPNYNGQPPDGATLSTNGSQGVIAVQNTQTLTIETPLLDLTFPPIIGGSATIAVTSSQVNDAQRQVQIDLGPTGPSISLSLNMTSGNLHLYDGTTGHDYAFGAVANGQKLWLELASDATGCHGRAWLDGSAQPAYQLNSSAGANISIGWFSVEPTTWTGFNPDTVTYAFDNLDISGIDRCTQYRFDNFNRTVASGWGVSDYGSAWNIGTTGGGYAMTFDVNGSAGEASLAQGAIGGANVNQYVTSGPWTSAFTMTARVNIVGSAHIGVVDFSVATGVNATGHFAEVYFEPEFGDYGLTFDGAGPTGAMSFPDGWYLLKWQWTPGATSTASMKVWADGTSEPGWMLTTSVSGSFTPSYFTVWPQINWHSTGGTCTVAVDYIDFDYTGKPCYQDCTTAIIDNFNRSVSLTGPIADGAVSLGEADSGQDWFHYDGNTPGAYTESVSGGSASWDQSPWTSFAGIEDIAYFTKPNGIAFGASFRFFVGLTQPEQAIGYAPQITLSWGPGEGSDGGALYCTMKANIPLSLSVPGGGTSGLNSSYWTWSASTWYNVRIVESVPSGGSATTQVWIWPDSGSQSVSPQLTAISNSVTEHPDWYFQIEGLQNAFPGHVPTTHFTYGLEEVNIGTCTPVYSVAGATTPISGFWCESLTPVGAVLTTSAPYQPGTVELYVNGALQVIGGAYNETTPTAGTITLTFTPMPSDTFRVCYTVQQLAGGGGGSRPLVL